MSLYEVVAVFITLEDMIDSAGNDKGKRDSLMKFDIFRKFRIPFAKKKSLLTVVRAGSQSMHEKKPPLKLSWHLTRMCNYNCSYCFQKKEKHHPASKEKTLEVAKKLIRIFGNEKVRIAFFGGEPLIHPSILDLVKFYNETLGKNCRLMAQTNGSRKISFYNKLFNIDPSFHINQSVHLERVDEIQFLEKLALFCENNRKPKINIMFLPSYREKAKRLCEKILQKGQYLKFRLDISLIRSPESNFKRLYTEYTEDDFIWRNETLAAFENLQSKKKRKEAGGEPIIFLDFLNESKKLCRLTTRYSDALRHNLLSFKGMTCLLGHRLKIDTKGNLKMPCVGNQGAKINVYKDELSEIDYLKAVICPKAVCHCKADVTSAKFISDEFSPKYFHDPISEFEAEKIIEPVSMDWVLKKMKGG